MTWKKFWVLLAAQWWHVPNIGTEARAVGAVLLIWTATLDAGHTITEQILHPSMILTLWVMAGCWTATLFIVVAATDKLDGVLAKKVFGTTALGKILDPMVDKILMVFSIGVGIFLSLSRDEYVLTATLVGLGIFLSIREVDAYRLKKAANQAQGGIASARQSGRVSMVAFCVAMAVALLPIIGWSSVVLKPALLVVAALLSRRAWNDYRKEYGEYKYRK